MSLKLLGSQLLQQKTTTTAAARVQNSQRMCFPVVDVGSLAQETLAIKIMSEGKTLTKDVETNIKLLSHYSDLILSY